MTTRYHKSPTRRIGLSLSSKASQNIEGSDTFTVAVAFNSKLSTLNALL